MANKDWAYYSNGVRVIVKCAECDAELNIPVVADGYLDLTEEKNVTCMDVYVDISNHDCCKDRGLLKGGEQL